MATRARARGDGGRAGVLAHARARVRCACLKVRMEGCARANFALAVPVAGVPRCHTCGDLERGHVQGRVGSFHRPLRSSPRLPACGQDNGQAHGRGSLRGELAPASRTALGNHEPPRAVHQNSKRLFWRGERAAAGVPESARVTARAAARPPWRRPRPQPRQGGDGGRRAAAASDICIAAVAARARTRARLACARWRRRAARRRGHRRAARQHWSWRRGGGRPALGVRPALVRTSARRWCPC